MKTLSIYILIMALLAGSFSCRKSLESLNPNEPDETNFWKTENDALLGVNAVYANAYRNGTFARWITVVLNPRSDDGFASTGWPPLRETVDFTLLDYNFEVPNHIWDHHYRGIYRANQVIANVPNITMDETLKKRYIAEAKFHRAFYYFYLVTLWGNVPLVLQPSKPTDLPFQAKEAETWVQVEKDLSEAIPDLPLSYNDVNVGRVTRGAAYAMLGKAYMQQRKWQQAVDAFQWIVEGEGRTLYDLVANYRDNFLHTTENNKESIFEIQFKAQQSTTDDDDLNSNMGNQRGPFFGPGNGAGFNDMEMHRWVIYEFTQDSTVSGQRDPRLASTAIFDSMDVRGPNFTTIYGRTFSSMLSPTDKRVWYRKYQNDYFLTGETFEGPINVRVIRLGDVLLMYAEALNEVNRTTDAYKHVDRVRERAGLQKLSVKKPGLSQAQFRAQIMHERITELTGESTRWLDLARWGYFDDQAKINELKTRDFEFNNFRINKHKWFPILQSELDINPNLVQNPNY
jgi:starch-binding outer membrane protein, SusD/RagB family